MSTSTIPARFSPMALIHRDPWSARLLVVMAGLLVFFAVMRPSQFFSLRTWSSMATQFPEYGLLALGVMVTMFTAGIDLSVVAIANLTGICTAMLLRAWVGTSGGVGASLTSVLIAVATAAVVGTACGAFNGFLVSRLKIPAILATLGTLELFGGIAIILTEGKPMSGLPKAFGAVFAHKLFGAIPMSLLIFIVCAIIAGLILSVTGFGKKILMLGTNETAARFSGMQIRSLLMRTYIMSGILAAIAGIVMLAAYNSAKADNGASYTLLTVLIVVLGGVNPNGGSGRLTGVILSILMLQVLSSGLNMFTNISNFYRALIWGVVLLVVITVNEMKIDNPFARLRKGRTENENPAK
ncbi:MAG: ABC transporter permease [Actinomycetaceae bacterium]|nr:ABC transporter permease [Actinomycetaceae bacterium]